MHNDCLLNGITEEKVNNGQSVGKGHTAYWEHFDQHGNIIDSGVSHSGGTNPGRSIKLSGGCQMAMQDYAIEKH